MARHDERRSGAGTVVVALILIVLGAYYFLRNAFGLDLPELSSDVVVPAIAVLIGAALLYRAWQERADRQAPSASQIR